MKESNPFWWMLCVTHDSPAIRTRRDPAIEPSLVSSSPGLSPDGSGAGHHRQGFRSRIPVNRAKSRSLLVTMISPCAIAVASIRESRNGAASGS